MSKATISPVFDPEEILDEAQVFKYILGGFIDIVVATQIKSDCANIGRYKNTPQAALQGLSSVAERPYERLCQAEHFFAKCLRQCRGNRVFKSK